MNPKKNFTLLIVTILAGIEGNWGNSQIHGPKTTTTQIDSSIQKHLSCANCVVKKQEIKTNPLCGSCSGFIHSKSCTGCKISNNHNDKGWIQLNELPPLDSLQIDKKGE